MEVPMVKDPFSIIKNMYLLFGKMERWKSFPEISNYSRLR
jgi:hypothetical protein